MLDLSLTGSKPTLAAPKSRVQRALTWCSPIRYAVSLARGMLCNLINW